MSHRVLYASFDAVPAPKGASVHILESVRAIAGLARVDLVTLPGTLPDVPLPPGVEHRPYSPAGDHFLQRALAFGDAVAERILEARYDVVHVRSIWEGTPALLLQPGRQFRLVYEVNGLPSIELKYHYPGVGTNRDLLHRLRLQERALMRAAAVTLTPSHTTRRYLRAQGAPAGSIRVIPNGVHPHRFPVVEPPPSACPQVLYLGTLAPWQGVPFLIEAMRGVVAQRPATLRIVASGRQEWRRACERLISKLGLTACIQVLPPVPPEAVPGLLAESHVCVAPLTLTDRNVIQGCCPLKVLEYMAAGRPIVAARLPAVAEILSHEETALLYKPDKPRHLTAALVRVLDDPALARRLGAAAAQAVRQRFTWEHHNAALTQVYREVLCG